MKKSIKMFLCLMVCIVLTASIFAGCAPTPKELEYSGTALASGQVGAEYSPQTVTTATGTEKITYTLKTAGSLPAGLSFFNGTISGTPAAVTDGAKKFIVVAKADGFEDAEAEFSITIAPGGIKYTGKTLTPAWVGEPYSQSVAIATGVTANVSVTYAIKSGNLPLGLELVNGVIIGTPTEETAETVFTVEASAANYTAVQADFKLQVSNSNTLVYPGGALAAGLVGGLYSQDIAVASGLGDPDITYILKSGAPAWLSLKQGRSFGAPEFTYKRDQFGSYLYDDEGNRIKEPTPFTVVATGTPETIGDVEFTVIASAENFAVTEATFSFTVTSPVDKSNTFEAMYVDMDEMRGSYISGAPNGIAMLIDSSNPERLENASTTTGAISSHFIAYTHSVGFTVEWIIYSDRDAGATLNMSLAHEWESDAEMYYDPDRMIPGAFDTMISKPGIKISVNGEVHNYEPVTLKGKTDGTIFFEMHDFGTIQIATGINIITLTVLANELWSGRSAGGPMVDCMSIETLAGLTWNPRLDNLED